MSTVRAGVIVSSIWIMSLPLLACASGRYEASVADAMAKAKAAQKQCTARLKAGSTSVEYWRCSNDVLIATQRVVDPRNIDIDLETAARNLIVAAEFDAGKITQAEASALFHANSLLAQSERHSRLRELGAR